MSLLGPWVDITCSFSSYSALDAFDTLCRPALLNAVRTAMQWYVPEAVREPEFSPALHGPEVWEFLARAETKVYVMWGSKEMFMDECEKVARDMIKAGVDIRTDVVSGVRLERGEGRQGMEWHRLMEQDIDGTHTQPIFHPRRRAEYIRYMCDMLGVQVSAPQKGRECDALRKPL